MARIFLCHASEDKPQVRQVYALLKAQGFEPWLDEEELLGGQLWAEEIPKALQASTLILIFFSEQSVDKQGYYQRELKLALDTWQEIPKGQIHTIPLRLDESPTPDDFRPFQWIDLFREGWEERLIRSIRFGLEQRGQLVPEPPAARPPAAEPVATPAQPKAAAEADSEPIAAVVPPAVEPLEEWTNSIGMVFVRIPAGSFVMGSPDSDGEASGNEQPAHWVEITQPFDIGKYPVTQGQWEAVMGDNPSWFTGDPNRPVEQISWKDVQRFMAALNEREGVSSYRLPTEAQWEYACRAGTDNARYHEDLDAIAWYADNSNNETHDVGQKQPNAWGLYDMLGNVYEWCHDGRRVYNNETIVDPEGPTEAGAERVFRGGGWLFSAQFARSAYRLWSPPGYRSSHFGFRCLMFRT